MGKYAEDPHQEWADDGLGEEQMSYCSVDGCEYYIPVWSEGGVCARDTDWKRHFLEIVYEQDESEARYC